MQDISLYLAKFTGLIPPEKAVKNAVVMAIKNVLNLDIPIANIEVRSGQIFMRVHSVLRSEIFCNKTRLITEIKHFLTPAQGNILNII